MSQILTNRSKTLTKKLQILKSAAVEFRNKGYEAAQMEDIAARLQLRKGALYYYFPSKQDILYFCQNYSLDRLIQEARKILRIKTSSIEKLRLLIESHIVRVLDELDGASAHVEFQALTETQRKKLIRKRDNYEFMIRQVIEKGIHEKKFWHASPKLITLALFGSLNWCTTWYRPDGGLAPTDIAKFFSTMMLRAIKR